MRKLAFIVAIAVSGPALAQNNIITVPVAEVVAEQKVYVQPGVVVNSSVVQLGNIVTWGLPWNFQAGVTLIDLTMNYGPDQPFFPIRSVNPPMNPDVLINLQKGFKLNETFWVALGTQTGANIATQGIGFSTFNYVNGQAKFLGENLIVLGGYHGNGTRLGTDTDRFGLLAGFKVPITQALTISGDFISGNNARSYLNAGLGVKLTETWAVYGGAVIPAPNSGNKFAGTIQFSYKSK